MPGMNTLRGKLIAVSSLIALVPVAVVSIFAIQKVANVESAYRAALESGADAPSLAGGSLVWVAAIVAIAAVAGAAFAASRIAASFMTRFGDAEEAVREIGNGNLSVRMSAEGADEASALASAINATAAGIAASLTADRVTWSDLAAGSTDFEVAAPAAADGTVSEDAERLCAVLDRVAEGDLTGHVEISAGSPLACAAQSTNRLVDVLRADIGSLVSSTGALGQTSSSLSTISESLANSSSRSFERAQTASTTSGDISVNVQTVASGIDQMSASINEIATSASNAARVANEAVGAAERTNDTVARLGESSNEIGNVLKVITSIAEQTNLLALNATIEAARAGEAGKGFAVVANEVKELAKETARATEEIGSRILGIQSNSSEAIAAIGDITSVITTINDISSSIASAVEEQTATTNEMARSLSEAVQGTNEIATSVNEVVELVQSSASGASDAAQSTSQLTGLAAELASLVGKFRC